MPLSGAPIALGERRRLHGRSPRLATKASAEATGNLIRGQAIRSFIEVLDEIGGAGSREQFLSALRGDLAEAYRYGAIVASGWYPLEWYCDMHVAARKSLAKLHDVHRRIGFASTSRDIRGVYRFILALASPALAFSQSGRIISTYLKDCRAVVSESSPGRGVVTLSISDASSELLSDISGSIEAILTACGADHPTVSHRLGPDLAHAVFECVWTKDSSMRRLG